MAERINKYYKPAELEEAIALIQKNESFSYYEATDLLMRCYKAGWRLIKVPNEAI